MTDPKRPSPSTVDDSPDKPQAVDRRGIDRREWLKTIGVAASGAAVGAAAGCDGDDPQTPTDAGSDAGVDTGVGDTATDTGAVQALQPLRGDGSNPLDYIDTIVIVQMENRSFDHYFGSLSLVEGRTDVDGLTAEMFNPDVNGNPVLVAPLGGEWAIHPDPSHSHANSLIQFNGGAMDGFVNRWERLLQPGMEDRLDWVMGYHQRAELPAFYAMADSFTVCDRWFSGMMGPTWPNRFFSHAGSSEGLTGNRVIPDLTTAYPDLLAAGHTIGAYHQSIVYFALLLEDDLPRAQVPNHDIDTFFEHAQQGALPNVCIVEPDYQLNDDHPPQDIRFGQSFVAGVYEAMRQSPQWDRCLIVVFYDEHGGFYDHVAPPVPAGETRLNEGFANMGFRVPALLLGPLVKRGYCLSETVEHSSVPALLARTFGVDFPNERCRLAGDLSAALDLELVLDANRPDPPPMPMIDLSWSGMREQILRPFPQPELLDFVRRAGLADLPTLPQSQRGVDNYLALMERWNIARVID